MLRAIREDEDAARALGKNALAYKLQSLAIAAALGAIAGFFLALNLTIVVPDTNSSRSSPSSAYAVLILGGLASYWGVIVGLDRALDAARGHALRRAAARGDSRRRCAS